MKDDMTCSQNSNASEVNQLIETLQLVPHPEGGYYKRIFASSREITFPDDITGRSKTRYSGTAINYLLESKDFSAWHKITSDEVWFFHRGSAITIHTINPKTKAYNTVILGDPLEVENARFQHAIKAGTWFAATVNESNSYALVSCAVSPGFDFADFTLANREDLIAEFPEHSAIINRLTRIEPVAQSHTKAPTRNS